MKKLLGIMMAVAMVFSVATAAYADLGERPAPPPNSDSTVTTYDLGERP